MNKIFARAVAAEKRLTALEITLEQVCWNIHIFGMHSWVLKTFVYSGIRLFQAEGAIFQKIQEQGFAGHPNQTIQLRTEIKIPPEAVGRIIGRRGTKVIYNPAKTKNTV